MYFQPSPGANAQRAPKKLLSHETFALFSSTLTSFPAVMVSRWKTVIFSRFASYFCGLYSGKISMTFVSSVSSPSSIANPVAIDAKLLLTEYIVCGMSGA